MLTKERTQNVNFTISSLFDIMLIIIQGNKKVAEERRLREKMAQEHKAENRAKGQHIAMR